MPGSTYIYKDGYRLYVIDGREYVGVTSVLSIIAKPMLIPWANKQGRIAVAEALNPVVGQILTQGVLDAALDDAKRRPNQVRDEATSIGHRAHAMIESYLMGNPYEISPDLESIWEGFQQWLYECDMDVVRVERALVSRQYGYAGTVDYIGRRRSDGATVVVDFKTSKGIWDEYALQLAAYANMIEETDLIRVDKCWAVRFGKDRAEFEAKPVSSINESFRAFLAALTLWKGMRLPIWHEK